MLDEATFDKIYDIVSGVFDAPDRQLCVWITLNTKYFKVDLCFSTHDHYRVLDVIALYFMKRSWPRDTSGYQRFLEELDRAVYRYGWKVKGEQYAPPPQKQAA